jgi:hypothetical protein
MFRGRKEKRELEREIRFRQGLSRIRNYVERSRQTQKRFWELGKRALQLGDRRQFQNLALAYLRTGEVINRWERYLVAMETVAVQRDQVKATGEFLKAMGALADSITEGARPEELLKMQRDLERALTRAQTLDETLSIVMDAAGETLFSAEGLSEEALKELEGAMGREAAREEREGLDQRIAEGLRRIEEEMRKEMKS